MSSVTGVSQRGLFRATLHKISLLSMKFAKLFIMRPINYVVFVWLAFKPKCLTDLLLQLFGKDGCDMFYLLLEELMIFGIAGWLQYVKIYAREDSSPRDYNIVCVILCLLLPAILVFNWWFRHFVIA